MGDSPRKVLILKSSSLGDIIHTLPAVSALRQRFPNAQITWLVKKPWAAILEGNSDVDEVWPVDFSLGCWPALVQKLRRDHFDLVVDFQGLFRSGLLSWVSGACIRVGFARAREGATIFYTEQVELPQLAGMAWRLGDVHAVDRNLELVRHVGANPLKGRWHFPDDPEDQVVVYNLLHAAGVKKGDCLVGIAPWSRATLKCWPLERFVELSHRMVAEQAIRPVLLGGPDDVSLAKPFRDLEAKGLLNGVGQVSLRQLPVLLRHLKAFVGNDSAPLHMAAGLGIPVIGLYGPTNPKATGPYPLEAHMILQAKLSCSPCGQQTCEQPVSQECLQSIQTQEVFVKLCALLTASSGQPVGKANLIYRSGVPPTVQKRVKP